MLAASQQRLHLEVLGVEHSQREVEIVV